MTITVLDKSFKMTKDKETGIISYSHPECSTVITSDYRVFNAKNGRELKVYQNERLIGGQISSRFKNKRGNFSFGRLLAMMAGHEEGYYRIIDDKQPLTLDNVTTLKDYMKSPNKDEDKPATKKRGQKKSILSASINLAPKDDIFSGSRDIVISQDKIKEYFLDYVPCEDNMQYVTEDGLIFTDRAKALLHQLNVDKGKELAEMVMKDKGGWALAEKIYLSQVDYSTGKPVDYNFKKIYENDSGIKEMGDKTYLVEADDKDTHQFADKNELERWLKAKALVDLVIDMKYNVDKIAGFVG